MSHKVVTGGGSRVSTAVRGVLLLLAMITVLSVAARSAGADERPRIIIETDAGGDPDDEQSLVRFLLYANEFDVEGIISNRPIARAGENLNSERTGIGIVNRLVHAYAACYPRLIQHDRRYPSPAALRARTVAGYRDSDRAVRLIIEAVDRADPRPIWYCDWGTLHEGNDENNLKRALDRVLAERGPARYARFKSRIRLSSADAFGDHTREIGPPFPLWVDTFRPEIDGRRWYHRFSQITATAGGFDVNRDVLTGHGPLGALYPTNTTQRQKEGDSMTFLYLVPTGMNDPDHPDWGSWAGRYGLMDFKEGLPYYWANQKDTWEGTTDRDNTLRRWAVAMQNDFRARLDWCVADYAHANHPPRPTVRGGLRRTVRPGAMVSLDATGSSDPDGNQMTIAWSFYPEAGTYRGTLPEIVGAAGMHAQFIAPFARTEQTLHVLLAITDNGAPPLTRWRRVIVAVRPGHAKERITGASGVMRP